MLNALAALALSSVLGVQSVPTCRVGVEARTLYDAGRSYGGHARPVRVILWYPARASAKSSVTAASLAGADWLSPGSAEAGWHDWRGARRAFVQRLTEMRVALASTQAWTVGGCAGWLSEPRGGAAPLVVIGTGLSGAAYFHDRLAEVLADAGFAVVFVSVLGPSPGLLPVFDANSVQLMADDAAYAVRALAGDPRIDAARLGLVAWSVAGIAHLAVARQHTEVRAFVSLDSGVGYDYGPRLWDQLPGRQLPKAPFLHLKAGMASSVPTEMRLLQEIGAESRVVDGLTHAQFTDLPVGARFETAQRSLQSQVREFLQTHLVRRPR